MRRKIGGMRDERGISTLFEAAILLLILVLVIMTSIFIGGRINRDRAESAQKLNGIDRLLQ